jgi:hypothetical protein
MSMPPAVAPETIHDWFDELTTSTDFLLGGSELQPPEREEVKRLVHILFDIAQSVVTDLNRIAAAQEAIAKLLLQADRRGGE